MSRLRNNSGADPRAPSVKAFAKMIELFLGFGFIGVLWFLCSQAVGALQAGRCPTTAFASGSPRVAAIFVMLAPGFATIGAGFIAANVVTGMLPATRRFFDGDANLRKTGPFQRDQALFMCFALALAVAGLLVSFIASHAQFCLTPSTILNRSAAWEPMRSYPWSAVRSVTTSCRKGSKGSWDVEYQLGFLDGRRLDIGGGASGNAWKSQGQIFKELHPVGFRFDASRVGPDCGAENVNMLLQRP